MLTAILPRILADRLRAPSARRGWPVWTHYAATVALVLAAYAARLALDGIYHLPFLTFIPAILAASLLFDRGSGLLATVLSAALASRFLAGPGDAPRIGSGDGTVALAAFVVFGLFTAALIEAFRASVERLVEAERRARASEARIAALLADMNHRFKNSLHAVGGLLHAQGRRVEDATARAALEDAARRLRVLGRLHDRLHLLGDRAAGPVGMPGFLDGLCSDLRSTLAEGRPVAVRACADPIGLDAAQAVPVGLIVNEAVTNALKHAFPGERPGSGVGAAPAAGESAGCAWRSPMTGSACPGAARTRKAAGRASSGCWRGSWAGARRGTHGRAGPPWPSPSPRHRPSSLPQERPHLPTRSRTPQRGFASGGFGAFPGGAVARSAGEFQARDGFRCRAAVGGCGRGARGDGPPQRRGEFRVVGGLEQQQQGAMAARVAAQLLLAAERGRAGHHHDRQAGALGAQRADQVFAAHPRHVEVGHQRPERVAEASAPRPAPRRRPARPPRRGPRPPADQRATARSAPRPRRGGPELPCATTLAGMPRRGAQ